MAKFNKIDTLSVIRSTGIVPVFYNKDAELTKKVVKACYDGGIRAFEFTNRGDGAHIVFKELIGYVRAECPEMALGAGTILDAPTAALYLQLGADFLVSPCIVEEVIALANRRGVPYSPGCGTVTEIVHAMDRESLPGWHRGGGRVREERPCPSALGDAHGHWRSRTHGRKPDGLGK